MIACCDVDEFIKLISEKKILIYGAGYVAAVFMEALKKHGLEKNVYGFCVTDSIGEQNHMGEFWVKPISQIGVLGNTVVCIATHEVSKRGIEAILLQKGISDYIWIYPFLYTLYMGKPLKEGQWIDVRKMILKNENLYGMAVRWAAIDDYYGNFQGGFYLYTKAMKIHCNAATAEDRANSFIGLIQNWDTHGYDETCQIVINTDYEVIDGEHRVALALYHNQKLLQCKIYNGQNLHEEKALMTKEVLLMGGFTQEEIKILDGIIRCIKNNMLRVELC